MTPPILLLAWRRPDALRQVIDALRPLAPPHLFISCDGPHPDRPAEAALVAATRDVITHAIDWPCTVTRRDADTNQGCRLGVSQAITWFFEQVDAGIILEDDCVPHPDFLPFCADLLARYRDDPRVWSIGGVTFQAGHWRGDGSYYFSRYPHAWGWASWRDRWARYDSTLAAWPEFERSGEWKKAFDDPAERRYWHTIWDRLVAAGVPDTWDYQWTFAAIAQGGLTALPNRSLITNIGTGADATHTAGAVGLPAAGEGLLPLRHPAQVRRDREADRFTFVHHYAGGSLWQRLRSWWQPV